MNYLPEDFSEIHPWNELPKKKGYYITNHCTFYEKLLGIHAGTNVEIYSHHWSFFDGKEWRNVNNSFSLITSEDVGNWFGLNMRAK